MQTIIEQMIAAMDAIKADINESFGVTAGYEHTRSHKKFTTKKAPFSYYVL